MISRVTDERDRPLQRSDLDPEPLPQFERWFDEAARIVRVPEAMALATADDEGAAAEPDLAETGLLKKTLVIMLSEFGRTPKINKDAGRDHWANVFSCMLAGGGIRGGTVHGATDDFGHKAAVDPVGHHDYHATLLHLFGLDPEKLAFIRNGRAESLIDGQSGRVIKPILVDG